MKDVNFYSIAEMQTVCQQWKNDESGNRVLSGSLYNRYVLRQVSIYITRLCVRRGISANVATFAMCIAGVMGCLLCIPHSFGFTLAAGLCFLLFDLFDAVDGEIARWNATSTTHGYFLDQLSHLLVDYPSRGLAAMHLYVWTRDLPYLALAIATVGSSLLARTVSEIGKRINAETFSLKDETSPQPSEPELFEKRVRHWKSFIVATHPIMKARLVHILTVVGILLTYNDMRQMLVGLGWFYAIYTTLWVALEIPYYCTVAVVNADHIKASDDSYRWPI